MLPALMASRNGLMASFERRIGIDYSGAQTPTSSLRGLRVYQTLGGATLTGIRSSTISGSTGRPRPMQTVTLARSRARSASSRGDRSHGLCRNRITSWCFIEGPMPIGRFCLN